MVTKVRAYGLTRADRSAPYPLPDPMNEGGTFADWVQTFPFEVRLALAAAEAEAIAVDTEGEGPVFYEIEVPFTSVGAGMGEVMAAVTQAVREHLAARDVEPSDISKIIEQIRLDAIGSGDYYAGLNKMLRWVGIDTGDD